MRRLGRMRFRVTRNHCGAFGLWVVPSKDWVFVLVGLGLVDLDLQWMSQAVVKFQEEEAQAQECDTQTTKSST